jgi:hypothetical protein
MCTMRIAQHGLSSMVDYVARSRTSRTLGDMMLPLLGTPQTRLTHMQECSPDSPDTLGTHALHS